MDILAYSAVELAQAIKAGETTAVEAMKAVLDRIDASEESIHGLCDHRQGSCSLQKQKLYRSRLKQEN